MPFSLSLSLPLVRVPVSASVFASASASARLSVRQFLCVHGCGRESSQLRTLLHLSFFWSVGPSCPVLSCPALSVRLSACLFVCLFVCLSVCLSVGLSVCRSVCLSLCSVVDTVGTCNQRRAETAHQYSLRALCEVKKTLDFLPRTGSKDLETKIRLESL